MLLLEIVVVGTFPFFDCAVPSKLFRGNMLPDSLLAVASFARVRPLAHCHVAHANSCGSREMIDSRLLRRCVRMWTVTVVVSCFLPMETEALRFG